MAVIESSHLPADSDFALHAERVGPVRAEEFEQWVQEEGNPLELVEGWVLPMTPGTYSVGRLSGRLFALVEPIVTARGWSVSLDARHRLPEPPDTVLFPDLVIHRSEPEVAPGTETVVSVPDLVIEILGRGTAERDRGPRGVKFRAYEMSRVSEYYTAWPDGREVAGYRHDGSRFVPLDRDADGFFASPLLGRRFRLVPPALG